MDKAVSLGRSPSVSADIKAILVTGLIFIAVGVTWFVLSPDPTSSFVLLILVSGFGLAVSLSALILIARRTGRSFYLVKDGIEVWRSAGKRTSSFELDQVIDFFFEPVKSASDTSGFLKFRTDDGRLKTLGPLTLESGAIATLEKAVEDVRTVLDEEAREATPTGDGASLSRSEKEAIGEPAVKVQAEPPALSGSNGQFGFFDAVRNYWSNYANFSGRARRAEFWFTQLFLTIAAAVTAAIDTALFLDSGLVELGGVFGWIWLAVTVVPTISQTVRRLHDAGFSGWLILLYLVPLFGWVALFVMFLRDSRVGDNRWGKSPKES